MPGTSTHVPVNFVLPSWGSAYDDWLSTMPDALSSSSGYLQYTFVSSTSLKNLFYLHDFESFTLNLIFSTSSNPATNYPSFSTANHYHLSLSASFLILLQTTCTTKNSIVLPSKQRVKKGNSCISFLPLPAVLSLLPFGQVTHHIATISAASWRWSSGHAFWALTSLLSPFYIFSSESIRYHAKTTESRQLLPRPPSPFYSPFCLGSAVSVQPGMQMLSLPFLLLFLPTEQMHEASQSSSAASSATAQKNPIASCPYFGHEKKAPDSGTQSHCPLI